ncbi:unnamed protein product [Symbiodinium sp. KB8]|nr:unnamed protein product [Symbiodinium sp. KB8]
MAKPFTWDFEPRSVAFKLQLQASFHPSVGGCSVSLPFLGANGDLAAPVAVSLSSGETKQRQAGPGGRSAQTASVEKDLGSFNVTFEFVKGIQQAKLPISVALEGGREIASQARICLGPLLLTGSKALSPELYNPGEPPRSKRLRPRNAVAATFTDSLGVAGLYSLDVLVRAWECSMQDSVKLRQKASHARMLSGRDDPRLAKRAGQWLPQHCEVRISPSYVSMSSSSDAVVTSSYGGVVVVVLAFVVGGDGRGSWRSALEGGGAETFSLMSASGNADGAWNVKMVFSFLPMPLLNNLYTGYAEGLALLVCEKAMTVRPYKEPSKRGRPSSGDANAVSDSPGANFNHTTTANNSGEYVNKETKQYKAYCKRHTARNEEARLADKLFHIVDKQEAQVSGDNPSRASDTEDGGGLPAQATEATERVRIVSGGDDPTGGSMDQPMDNHTPPDWGDETEDENTLTSWPWGEMGRPSDKGPSEGILAERPNVPGGVSLQQRDDASGKGPYGASQTAQGDSMTKTSDLSDARSETLELSLRADVCPSRGNKKKRRDRISGVDSLHASGLLDEEGRQKIARREGLSKREDTTNYHSLGTVCTLRAALAVPVPLHYRIQDEEQEEHRKHWESTEKADGNVFTAKSLGDSPTAVPTQWAPKATPSRAKVGDVAGPWRRSAEEAAEDETKLLEAEDAEAASLELTQAVLPGALAGLDCRFERYGRIFLVCSEANDGEVTRAVLTCFHELNAALLGLRPQDGEFLLRELSGEEQADPHLDLLSGFCVLDGRSRLFVIEGLREGHSFSKLLEMIPRGPDAPKLLHNTAIGFGERLYISFGPRLKQVKLRGTLERLSFRPALYSWNKSVSTEDAAANEVPKQLMALKGLNRLRGARENPHFPKAAQIEHLQRLYGAYISDRELEGFPAEEAIIVKKRAAPAGPGADRRTSVAPHEATRDVLAEAVTSGQLGSGGTVRFQTRSVLKEKLDQTNAHYEEHAELRKSASVQNFQKTNKTLVRVQSQQNVRRNDLLGKKRERETPFLDGQVYLYSSQKLNSAELQKEWLRKHMAGHESEKVWTYNPTYMSQNFEFAGAAPPGVPKPPPPRPNDTYARLEGDDREVFRIVQARQREAFRKPPRDLDQSTVELLHEPFEEGEWFRIDLGEERTQPVAVVETFEPGKVPHNRRYTSTPFDPQHMLMGQEHDFGPKSLYESVHYHGRRPDEDRQEQYLEHNIKEMEAAASKIRFHHEMKTFTQGISRTGVTDLDRSERVLKDAPSYPMRGRVDGRLPESMRTMEPFHELGRPDLEWHARLRENDDTAPLDVFTGAHIKRDPEAGTGAKRSCMSGSLTKAPWRHEGTIKSLAAASSKSVTYVSAHNFNAASKPPQSRFCEDQLWKSASRMGITGTERSEALQYRRPHHYGVHL